MARTWSAPQTWSTGSTPGATEMNREVRDNLAYLSEPSYTLAYRTTQQSFTVSTDTTLSWEATETDVDNMWVVGSPTLFTIPSGWDGLWSCDASVVFASSGTTNATVVCYAWFRINGTTIIKSAYVMGNASIGATTVTLHRNYRFIAGDYVEVRFRSSANYDRINGTGIDASTFEMTWRGR